MQKEGKKEYIGAHVADQTRFYIPSVEVSEWNQIWCTWHCQQVSKTTPDSWPIITDKSQFIKWAVFNQNVVTVHDDIAFFYDRTTIVTSCM